MPKKGNSNSFEIALSGISCAIAVLFLSLGILTDWLLATGYFLGIVALMLPLSKHFFKGAVFAYAATCILTVIMGAAAKFWDLVPFIMFFGLHPIVNALQVKYKLNTLIAFPVKAVWFDCTLIASYHLVFGGVLGGTLLPENIYEIINKYIYLFIFTVGTAAFVLYDFLVMRSQVAVNTLVARIRK